MTLPHTYGLVLMLTILTMICWGSWANVLKIAKGWRFELLYYDYSIGVALGAALAGLTFGTWGSDGLRFLDDLAHAGTTNILCGFAGGVVFNFSNILVVGAIAVAGMGVGFPIGVGLALIVGVIWNYIVNPQGNPLLLFTGVALIVAAIVIDAIAYRAHAVSRSTAGDQADAAAKRAATWKGIRLAVVGGILMGMFYPLVEIGKTGQNGLGPYAVGFVFGLGVLASVFVFNLYFMRFPIDGPRLSFGDYLRGNSWVHFFGPRRRRGLDRRIARRTSSPPAPRRSCKWDRPSATPLGKAPPWWERCGASWCGRNLPEAARASPGCWCSCSCSF